MSRRRFLKATAVIGAGVATGAFGNAGAALAQQRTAPRSATTKPIRLLLAGYAPPNNGFSLSLKRIGERVQTKFGKDVDVKYLFNILDLGYKGEDLPWLVEDGVLTMAYQSSSYFTEQIPDLGIADLPFLFSDVTTARGAMDGKFGATLQTTYLSAADLDDQFLAAFDEPRGSAGIPSANVPRCVRGSPT